VDECIGNKKFCEELIANDMYRIENDESNNSSIFASVFIAPVTFLLSRCLATIGGYTYRHTYWWEGLIKYPVQMGLGAMIYMPDFIKIGSAIQKLMLRGYTNTW
jgi:hypothetical protein